MLKGRMKKYEERLDKINAGLSKPRVKKDLDTISRFLGSLAKGFSGVSHCYKVTVQDNQFTRPGAGEPINVILTDHERDEKIGSKLTLPGVYSLKTNEISLSPEQIWRSGGHISSGSPSWRVFSEA
jgi:hypothetical protein